MFGVRPDRFDNQAESIGAVDLARYAVGLAGPDEQGSGVPEDLWRTMNHVGGTPAVVILSIDPEFGREVPARLAAIPNPLD